MDTPPLNNDVTTAAARLVPQIGMAGESLLVAVVKQKFHVDERGHVGRVEGAEVRLADEPWDPDAPETSSVRYPSDVSLRKPSTDVLVVGSAVQPGRVRAPALDVSVRVGAVKKSLRVFGRRVYYKALVGVALTAPEPFDAVELKWENAFGGADFSDPRRPLEEARNPVGRGLARNADALEHKPAPQVEDPRELVTDHRTRPMPAGLAPLGRHWEPRRGYAGTMDATWMRERMPLLPLDFDPRHYQTATPELIAPQYLRGGEPVELVGLSERGPLRFTLPRIALYVGTRTDDARRTEYPTAMDTVLFEPGSLSFELTFRALVPAPLRGNARVRSVQIHEKAVR